MFYVNTEYLLKNTSYAKKVGEKGREYVLKKLSSELKGLELENIYHNILKQYSI